MCTRMIRRFSPKYRVIPAQTLTPFDVNIITLSLKYIFLYICLTSEADRNEFQCHANCSVFQVLICLKSKKEKSVTLVLSLVLDVLVPPSCFSHTFGSPRDAGKQTF